jgi:hypothetical protein
MRKYLLTYWSENWDECIDLERVIEAPTLQEALKIFLQQNIVHKRIESIKELAG